MFNYFNRNQQQHLGESRMSEAKAKIKSLEQELNNTCFIIGNKYHVLKEILPKEISSLHNKIANLIVDMEKAAKAAEKEKADEVAKNPPLPLADASLESVANV